VFFTYESLSKIEEAQHSAIFLPVFACDRGRGHATAGLEKNWTALHDNARILLERRSTSPPPYVWEAPR